MPGIICEKMCPQDVCYIFGLMKNSAVLLLSLSGYLSSFDAYCNTDVLVCVSLYMQLILKSLYRFFLSSSLYSFCVPVHCFTAVIDRKYLYLSPVVALHFFRKKLYNFFILDRYKLVFNRSFIFSSFTHSIYTSFQRMELFRQSSNKVK